jgi:hypothetical protein
MVVITVVAADRLFARSGRKARQVLLSGIAHPKTSVVFCVGALVGLERARNGLKAK